MAFLHDHARYDTSTTQKRWTCRSIIFSAGSIVGNPVIPRTIRACHIVYARSSVVVVTRANRIILYHKSGHHRGFGLVATSCSSTITGTAHSVLVSQLSADTSGSYPTLPRLTGAMIVAHVISGWMPNWFSAVCKVCVPSIFPPQAPELSVSKDAVQLSSCQMFHFF